MDQKLLFLVSPPRSGSSLLQQLLYQHPKLYSAPEPWIMLQLISIYKDMGITEGYDPSYATINLIEYLKNRKIPVAELKNEIRALAFKLYKLTELEQGMLFLDKTPRYYYILNELAELFPMAKFILLVRNPLSVFASVLNYHYKNQVPLKFRNYTLGDLITSYKNLIDFADRSSNTFVVRYEDLVNNSDGVMTGLFDFIGIEQSAQKSEYHLDAVFQSTRYRDHKSVHKHSTPVTQYIAEWKRIIDTGSKKRLALFYLGEIQKLEMERLGYEVDDIRRDLQGHKVSREIIPAVPSYVFGKGTSFLRRLQHRIFLELT